MIEIRQNVSFSTTTFKRSRTMDGQSQLIAGFVTYLLETRHLSGLTVRAYRSDLGQFCEFICLTVQEVGDIDKALLAADEPRLKAFIEDTKKTVLPNTAARKSACLRSFYKWLKWSGAVSQNPADNLHTPKFPTSSKPPLTTEQIAKLRAMPNGSSLLGLRDLALLEIIKSTGIWAPRLAKLNQSDVGVNGGRTVLRVRRKDIVEVPLDELAATALARYQKVRTTTSADAVPLFVNKHGSRISGRSIRRKIEGYIALAGIGPEIDMRNLRNTYVLQPTAR